MGFPEAAASEIMEVESHVTTMLVASASADR